MLKEDVLVGVISIYRQEVRPFTDKQVELVQNFAAQAVIAIENTRLLNELRNHFSSRLPPPRCSKSSAARRSICQPYSTTLVESAAQLCNAEKAQVLRPTGEGAGYYSAASYGHSPAYDAHMRTLAFPPGKGSVVGRVQSGGQVGSNHRCVGRSRIHRARDTAIGGLSHPSWCSAVTRRKFSGRSRSLAGQPCVRSRPSISSWLRPSPTKR